MIMAPNDELSGREIKPNAKVKKAQALLNIACGLEGADSSLLPASFRALESDMGLSPSKLSSLALLQSLTQALFGPFWGYFSDRYDKRGKILAYGCFLWGILTMLMSFAHTYLAMGILRFNNGIALASINPISQTILARLFPSYIYGRVFGWVQVSINIGILTGTLFCTSLSEEIILGLNGWRVVFFTVGFLCLIFAGVLLLQLPKALNVDITHTPVNSPNHTYTKDKAYTHTEPTVTPIELMETEPSIHSEHIQLFGRPRVYSDESIDIPHTLSTTHSIAPCESLSKKIFKPIIEVTLVSVKCFKIPSFVVITVQGIFGSCPWNALSFLTMYYQYSGLSNLKASLLTISLTCGLIPGSILGGYVGDYLNQWSTNHGRPFTAQISVICGLPLIACVFQVLPSPTHTLYIALHATFLFLFGLISSWCSAGVNRPILLDIIDASDRGQILGWLVAIEGSSAAVFGAPFIAFLAEVFFGYDMRQEPVINMRDKDRLTNQSALGNALTIGVVIPFLICGICYSILHITLPSDLKRIKIKQNYTHLASQYEEVEINTIKSTHT